MKTTLVKWQVHTMLPRGPRCSTLQINPKISQATIEFMKYSDKLNPHPCE